jgi:calcium/calmodulin-dependent protein kinase I
MDWHSFKFNNIKEDYEFKAILGEGAFGKVIQAIKKDDNQFYAIKMVAKSELDDEDLKNLQFELTVLDKIDHPNVTKMIEAYDNPTAFFIVLELMDGGELFDRIVDKECYSENLAANTLKPIVDGIKYCHDQNIAHRDLKPENLLYLTEDDESIIKISDFGLAKLLDSPNQMMSTVCGTPSYLAPEIITGHKYTTQCDIWSLGVILYTL